MCFCSRFCWRRFAILHFKVEHIVAITAIFSNICTARAHKRLLMNFRCKYGYRRSIPRFPIRVQNFSDLATFLVDFFLYFICWMSAIFLLPGRLTYWPRKYTTRVDHHVDNTHQVWSWYDHPLPSYSAFVCWGVPWSCDLDIWPFDIQQLSYMVSLVINPATKSEDPTAIHSWVTGYNGSHWLSFKIRTRPLRMRRMTLPVSRGSKSITFLESPTPICLYTLCLKKNKTPNSCP